jgi:hypothetical protein
MSNLQIASLVLRSCDIPQNGSNQYGSSDQYSLTQTWNNINLRILLGDMYDKYDLFNICLNTVTTGSAVSNTGISNDDRNVILKLSGLPFINQTYSVKQGCNTNVCHIGSFLFISNAVTTQYYFSNNFFTFGKSQESCNLTIQYSRAKDDTLPSTVNIYPNMIFSFYIIGIPKDNLINNSSQEKITFK